MTRCLEKPRARPARRGRHLVWMARFTRLPGLDADTEVRPHHATPSNFAKPRYNLLLHVADCRWFCRIRRRGNAARKSGTHAGRSGHLYRAVRRLFHGREDRRRGGRRFCAGGRGPAGVAQDRSVGPGTRRRREDVFLGGQVLARHERPRDAAHGPERVRGVRSQAAGFLPRRSHTCSWATSSPSCSATCGRRCPG